MKSVYLIVTDLHLDFSKSNRINYFGEILDAMTDIIDIAQRYQAKGYEVNQCLLGDVFDSGMSRPSDAMQCLEIFRYYCSTFKQTYAVIGNHEITYARDNPFWFLVSEVQDDSLSDVKKFIQPRGLVSTISVPSTLSIGDTTFYFNHYGTPAKEPNTSGTRIGLFHQNVGSNDICKMWGTFDNVEEASYIQGYHYCFFGHMHLAKGKFYLNDKHTCIGEWLGSIGRTKVTEIIDDSLTVNIPGVVFYDNKFHGIEDNFITLKSFDECVDKRRYNAYQQNRKLVEDRKKQIPNSFLGNTLFNTLETSFEGANAILLDFLNKPWEEIYVAYNEDLKNPLSEVDSDGDGDI